MFSNIQCADDKSDLIQSINSQTQTIVRKSVSVLTQSEINDYVTGVKALKAEKNGNSNTYDNYVNMHNKYASFAHSCAAFLPWHRYFILQFERDMQRVLKNPNYALPYWQWELSTGEHDTIWSDTFMGRDGTYDSDDPNASPVKSGPFQSGSWVLADGKSPLAVAARFYKSGGPHLSVFSGPQ